MEIFEKTLKDSGLSVTAPRKSIFNLLLNAGIPMSINNILYELRTVDRSTVYRTIDTFEKLGITKRVWFGNRSKYELGEKFKEHHHHLVCDECGAIKKIDSPDLEKVIAKVAKKTGYRHTSHHLEIFGRCKKHQ